MPSESDTPLAISTTLFGYVAGSGASMEETVAATVAFLLVVLSLALWRAATKGMDD